MIGKEVPEDWIGVVLGVGIGSFSFVLWLGIWMNHGFEGGISFNHVP